MEELQFDQTDWEKGLSITELIAGMTVNKEAMQRRHQSIELTGDERARLAGLTTRRRLLILTEEWCSDCLMNLPILAKLAEDSPNIEVRFFNRKDWPELRAYFNGHDIYSLPTVQILDDFLRPLAVWVERPQAAHQRLADWKEAHPEVEHTRRRADLTSEQKREMLKVFNERLLEEMENWYAQDLQSETVREVVEILESLEKTPSHA
ncbi:MAG: thioredoxin family protein [Bellilinea sp.]